MHADKRFAFGPGAIGEGVPPVIADVAGGVRQAARGPAVAGSVRQRLAQTGSEIVPREEQTPAALAALQKVEIAKWWPIVKDAGIKAE